jgi:hypothetical protein
MEELSPARQSIRAARALFFIDLCFCPAYGTLFNGVIELIFYDSEIFSLRLLLLQAQAGVKIDKKENKDAFGTLHVF